MCFRSFGREARGDPIGLAGGVVEDRVSESFEPPRGSGALVSETVPAVDNDRATTIEYLRRFEREGLEGKMGRAGQMFLFVLVLWQHIRELLSFGDESPHLGPRG